MSKSSKTQKSGLPPAPTSQEAWHKPKARRFGFLAGELKVPPDFDEMGREAIEQLFDDQD